MDVIVFLSFEIQLVKRLKCFTFQPHYPWLGSRWASESLTAKVRMKVTNFDHSEFKPPLITCLSITVRVLLLKVQVGRLQFEERK